MKTLASAVGIVCAVVVWVPNVGARAFHCGHISSNETWSAADTVHIVSCDVFVDPGVTLTIEPGACVKFSGGTSFGCDYAALVVDGTLIANAAVGSRIFFTSLRDDAVAGDTNGDGSGSAPAAGDWEAIRFSPLSLSSSLDYCTIRYGGRVTIGGCGATQFVSPLIDVVSSSPSFNHCQLSKGLTQGFSFTAGSASSISGSSITACDGWAISQDVDSAPTLQSTTAINNPGGNGIQIDGGMLLGEARWRSMGLPFVLTHDVVVAASGALTIDPGTCVKLAGGLDFGCSYSGIVVDGVLSAIGTSSSKITFTSLKDDALLGDSNNDGSTSSPAAGDWESIRISALSSSVAFDYCTFRYGGRISIGGCGITEVVGPMIDVRDAAPVFNHSTFSQTLVQGLSFTEGATSTVSNSTISGCLGYALIQDVDSAPLLQFTTLTNNPGGNGIQIDGGTVQGDVRWRSMGVPFVITHDVTIAPTGTLRVDSGTCVKFAGELDFGCSYAGLFIDGILLASGTPVGPIVFTSLKDDAVAGDTNNNGSTTAPAAGNWEGLRFGAGASGSLNHCTIRYAGRVSIGGCGVSTTETPMVNIVASSPTLGHCTLTNALVDVVACGAGAMPLIVESTVLSGSGYYGVRNDDPSVLVDARAVWWGDATGPLDPSPGPPDQNLGGLGSKVSDHVLYRPWLDGTPTTDVAVVQSVTTLWLAPLVPSPTSGATTIAFTLPSQSEVSVRIYDVSGRMIRKLANGVVEAGKHILHWDGLDEKGCNAAGGLYFCRLVSGGQSRARTLIIRP